MSAEDAVDEASDEGGNSRRGRWPHSRSRTRGVKCEDEPLRSAGAVSKPDFRVFLTTRGVEERAVGRGAGDGGPAMPSADRPPLWQVLDDGAWRGQPCFIVGGGPSLRGFEFARLRGRLTIGVNRAYERFDPCVNLSIDTRFLRWLLGGRFGAEARERFQAAKATKVWLEERKPAAPFPKETYFVAGNGREAFTGALRDGFCHGGNGANSGFYALNLAVCLGANPVYLLGFDLQGGENGKQTWWHEGYPDVQDGDVYARFQRLFERHAEAITKRTRVVNLNPGSGLRCFEFGRFEDVPPPPSRPLVIGYYTEGTGYEKEAQRMIASAHRFGLETDVRGIQSRGGWQANTYYKCLFLQEMLEEHPDRPLLFLDADVEVKQYPALFDDLPADFAVNMVDWAQYGRRARRELNTSVIYLRNTPEVRGLLQAWERLNIERFATGTWEQKNLQDLIERHEFKGSMRLLPDPYCQIFDMMKAAGPPVIELRQASRRLKAEVGP